MTGYAEAFERDPDPEVFSLEVMIAHERGHQLLARHPRIAKRVAGLSVASEEILASLLDAMVCSDDTDKVTLYAKAAAETVEPTIHRGNEALVDVLAWLTERNAPAQKSSGQGANPEVG